MAYKVVLLDDSILDLRNKLNVISKFAGDSDKLTTNQDSDLIGAINEIDAVFDASANQIKSGSLYINDSGNITLDAGGGDIFLRDDSALYGTLTNTSGNLIVKSGSTTNLTMSGANVTSAGIITATTSVITPLITRTGNLTLDASGDIILDAGGADVTLKDDGTTYGSLSASSGSLVIRAGSSPTTAITITSDSSTFAGAIHASAGGSLTGTWTNLGTVTTVDINGGSIDAITLGTNSPVTSAVFNTVDINGGTIDGVTIGVSSADSARFSKITSALMVGAPNITLDTVGDIILDAGGGDVEFKDDGTQFAALQNTGGNLIVKSGSTTALTFSGANITLAGTMTPPSGLNTSSNDFKGAINEIEAVFDASAKTINTTGDFTVDINGGDIILDAGLNDIILKDSGSERFRFNLETAPVLEITGDGTISGSGSVTIDAVTNIILDANGANVLLKDNGTQFGALTNTSGNLIVKSGSTTAMTFSGTTISLAGAMIPPGGLSTTANDFKGGINELKTAVDLLDSSAVVSSAWIGSYSDIVQAEFTTDSASSRITHLMNELARRMVNVYDSAGSLLNTAT
tara:strand:+ start:12272 stop:13996 length:1725 start_codon:yes stop_codon:yes gene_type:complete